MEGTYCLSRYWTKSAFDLSFHASSWDYIRVKLRFLLDSICGPSMLYYAGIILNYSEDIDLHLKPMIRAAAAYVICTQARVIEIRKEVAD